MALYRDVHSRIAVRDRFADDNEYAAELVQVGWMTGESRREVVPKSRWSPSCEFLFRIPNLIIDHAPTRNWNSARRLPVDTLKIDQSFVRDMLEDSEDLSIVRSVIQLASVFGKQVIAEGVESLAHCYKLEQLGCSNVQGYGIAKPMNATVLPEWCKTWPQTASLHKN